MTTKILIATVGGSCAPVARAVLDHQPDRVYFICSRGVRGSSTLVDGPGEVCGDTRTCPKCKEPLGNPRGKSIVAQCALASERYEKIEVANPDDVQECFNAVVQAYERGLASGQDIQVIADYTGGTKTMTAALMRAATGRYGRISKLSLVRGERSDLRAVLDGTESAWIQEASAILFEEQWRSAQTLANSFHYSSADALLTVIKQQGLPNASSLASRSQKLSTLCRGFDAWDRFDHAEAQRFLQPQRSLLDPRLLADLRELASSADAGYQPAQWGVPSVIPVYDLLRNAERRAAQGRYDDAVARCYRAIELLAQNRLLAAFGITSDRVDPALVEEWLREHLERVNQPRIRVGLQEGYAILLSKQDPLGHAFEKERKHLQDMLQRRNASVLAHGARPIRKEEWPALRQPVEDFINLAVGATGLKMQPSMQFPTLNL